MMKKINNGDAGCLRLAVGATLVVALDIYKVGEIAPSGLYYLHTKVGEIIGKRFL